MKKFLLSIFAVLFAFAGAQAQETVTDKLVATSFTATSTSYTNFTGVKFDSEAVYAGNSAKTSGGAIQLRSKNSNSGIVTTVSGGKAKSVTIEVESGSNTLDVYGSNTPFSDAGDLYNTTATKLGSLSASGTLNITGDYEYIGLRSKSGALYLTSISIVWETNGEGGEENPEAPAAPTLPEACNFDDAMIVEITVEDGAAAYYSLNDENNWIEGSSVEITETTTVYAKAVKDELSSGVVSKTYTKNTPVTPPAEGEVVDVLTRELTGITGTTYKSWSGKTVTSDAVYAGQSAGGNDAIQLRSNNNNSGIVTTTAGGKVKKIVVEWNSNTADDRTLNIYGKNSAYSAPTDLYDNSKQGTLLGTIVCGTSTELVIEGDYEYIGMCSNSGAMYLTSISITWDESAGVTPVAPNAPALPASTTFEGSMMVEITSIAADATVYYTTDESDPATSATRVQYTEPFEITATTTVKAVAVNEVGASDLAEATYTLVETITLSNCTVAELIEAYASGNNIAKDATVVGYIVGAADGSLSKAEFGTATVDTNILLADDPYETNVENCIPVQLPSGVRTALNLKDNSDNYQKKVILTGDVEAYFSVAGLRNTSAYEFVDELYHTLTVSDAGWATLYLATSARIPSTIEAYTVTGVNNGWVSLTQVAGVIPANTGIIVKADAGDYKFFMGETATADVTGNLLSGSAYNRNIDEEAYVLSNVEGVVGLYKAQMTDGTWLNNANKAYLPASAVPNKTAEFYGFDWDGTTGVDQITENREQSTVIYDLTGRRVEAITAPGIYIVNGKKTLVK